MWISETEPAAATASTIHILTWKTDMTQDMLFDRAMSELDALVAVAAEDSWILNVSAITMLSSNAIAQLIGVVRRVNLAHGRIVLAYPAPAVAAVLRMTRLTKLLPMYDDIAQAKAAILSE
jgi:anti-anti-sigma factor